MKSALLRACCHVNVLVHGRQSPVPFRSVVGMSQFGAGTRRVLCHSRKLEQNTSRFVGYKGQTCLFCDDSRPGPLNDQPPPSSTISADSANFPLREHGAGHFPIILLPPQSCYQPTLIAALRTLIDVSRIHVDSHVLARTCLRLFS